MTHKFAFVGIAGKPNVGKSTLINALIGEKIAITSEKAQTTRHRILGVKTTPNFQLVFVDTPGIHESKHVLNQMIVKQANQALLDVDVMLWVVDRKKQPYDDKLYQTFKTLNIPIILVINKIDQLSNKSDIDAMIMSYLTLGDFDAVIPISALKETYLQHLEASILEHAYEEGPMFPEDYTSDQQEHQIISEWIREKILSLTQQEVPHSAAVIVESIEENKKQKTLDIRALIIVERDSQKKILIGKQGEKLKQIGMLARQDLNKTFHRKVHLELWIKVKKDWRNKMHDVMRFGYGVTSD